MTRETQTVWCKKCSDESFTPAPHSEGWEHINGYWLCQICRHKVEEEK